MLLGPGCEGLQGSLQGAVWGGKHSPPPPGATPQRQDWAAWHVPTASGQASFCALPAPLALTGLATLLSTGWHLLSVVPLPTANMGRGQSPWQPQTGTTVTGAVVRVELAWHMGLVPCAQRPSWVLWTGAKLGRVWGCPCWGPVPAAQPGSPSPSHSVRLWAGCQLWLHPGQQVAPLGTVITHFSPNLPGQTLAQPSLGPSACPLEGGPGRPGLVPAPTIIRHGSGEDSRCSWPVPQAWPLWKVSGQGNPPMGAEVESNSKLGADGVHATPAMGGCPATGT